MRRRVIVILLILPVFVLTGCAGPVEIEAVSTAPPEATQAPAIVENTVEDIHINQLGYRPDDTKTVRIAGEWDSFSVMNADTGAVAYEGRFCEAVRDRGADEMVVSGDFSALAAPGRYVVQIPGLGISYAFAIADGVYGDLSGAVLKMLYYQRCGVDLTEEYAGQWNHPACHTDSGEIYGEEGSIFDGSGGWHDAGDYGKYAVPVARTIADLFLAYTLYPNAFGDGTGIPESGNGIPDILDEARVGLDWLLKMQDPDTGGVYHKFTPKGFPMMEIMPQADNPTYYAIGISPTATGSFSAIMAQAARTYADIDGEFANQCLVAAKSAYAWMQANPDASPFVNPDDVVTGDYRDVSHRDEYYWASMELYATTGETAYLEAGSGYSRQTTLYWSDTLELYDVSLLGTISYLLSGRDTGSALYQTLCDSVMALADEITAGAAENGYGISMDPEDYIWGSNMIVADRGVVLLFANALAPNGAYVRAARGHFDYLLGCNSLSQCFVTGFGTKGILHPHHRPTVADMIKPPIPGMVSGGPNGQREDDIARTELSPDTPPAKCFLDDTGAYSLNEVTTYWNSPMVILCAYFNGQ